MKIYHGKIQLALIAMLIVLQNCHKITGCSTLTEIECRRVNNCIFISGHIYCIGECGGATQEGKCPECGTKIGGTQHRLVSDNSLAPEMDGATHAAGSDTANNIRNWDLGN
jgi:hypothetical protein